MKYSIVYERSPHNFSAYVRELPGCIAAGETRREVEHNIRIAIKMHVAELKRHGLTRKDRDLGYL